MNIQLIHSRFLVQIFKKPKWYSEVLGMKIIEEYPEINLDL